MFYYASTLCAMNTEHHKAHALGTIAVKLAEKYGIATLQNYTYHVFCLAINHWLQPLSSDYAYWKKASELELASGSPYSGYVYLQLAHVLFAMGVSLGEVKKQVDRSKKFLLMRGHEGTDLILKLIVEQPLKCLKGQTDSDTSLADESFNTEEFMKGFGQYPFFKASYCYSELRLKYLFAETIPLDELNEKMAVIESTQQGQIILVDSYMFYVLHLITALRESTSDDTSEEIQLIEEALTKMEAWAELNPITFKHKYLLLKAVYEAENYNSFEVIDLFDEATDIAMNEKFTQDAALICEEAAKFWLKNKKSHLAKPYLERAYVLYERWGAKTKLYQLNKVHTSLLKTITERENSIESLFNESTSSLIRTSSFSDKLDFLSIIKASQAISKHMNVQKLTQELTSIVVENAGATKGILILKDNEIYKIKNIFYKDEKTTSHEIVDLAFERSNELSQAIVNYTIRTQKDVVLDQAFSDMQFASCSYIQKHKISSICCLPIMHQDQIRGLIYLENDQVQSAFKMDRIKIIHLLASQATISMENAKVYNQLDELNKNLEEKVKERTYELYEKNTLLNKINLELERLSITDQLTNIFNRRYIEDKLEKEIELCRRYNKSMAVILLDVDHFKHVNDTYGHGAGDEVLIQISSTLKNLLQVTESLGRWGGEEFILVIPDAANIEVLAEKCREVVEALNHPVVGKVTISLGVAIFTENDNPTTIVSRADEALYEAKEAGRNQVKFK